MNQFLHDVAKSLFCDDIMANGPSAATLPGWGTVCAMIMHNASLSRRRAKDHSRQVARLLA